MPDHASNQQDLHPWLRLLDLELRRVERPKTRRRVGRPRKAFPRKAIHLTLTDSELDALDEVRSILSDRFGRPVHRGQVVGFTILRLRNLLQHGRGTFIPEEIDSFSSLATYLDSLNR